jgi:hypothetical protein
MDYFLQGTEPLNGVASAMCTFDCSGTFEFCANEQCIGAGALGCTFNTPPTPPPLPPPCPGNMMCGGLGGYR